MLEGGEEKIVHLANGLSFQKTAEWRDEGGNDEVHDEEMVKKNRK